MNKQDKTSHGQKKYPVPARTEYTHAGMRRDSRRPVTGTPVPNDESVVEEMHWVMENQK